MQKSYLLIPFLVLFSVNTYAVAPPGAPGGGGNAIGSGFGGIGVGTPAAQPPGTGNNGTTPGTGRTSILPPGLTGGALPPGLAGKPLPPGIAKQVIRGITGVK